MLVFTILYYQAVNNLLYNAQVLTYFIKLSTLLWLTKYHNLIKSLKIVLKSSEYFTHFLIKTKFLFISTIKISVQTLWQKLNIKAK